jgi:hypothetical protein
MSVAVSNVYQVRMARFDALPPAVRAVINGSAFEFQPRTAEEMLLRGVSPARCAERLQSVDARMSARKAGA